MKSLVILIAAVYVGVAVGENSKPIFELQKKWPLIGALKLLQPHTDLVTRSVQPRQAVFGTCTLDELVGLASAVPRDCDEDIASITGGDLNALFNNVLNRDPATLTEIYRIFLHTKVWRSCCRGLLRLQPKCNRRCGEIPVLQQCSWNAML